MIFKMDVKPNFTVDNEKAISVPPTVDFGKSPAPPAVSPTPAPAPKN
jgi:LemA protein